MKLLDFLHHMRDGLGQGVAARPEIGEKPVRVAAAPHRMMLDKVAKVIVETWDTGPFPTDHCWLLADEKDRILMVLPTGIGLAGEVLDRIGKTKGFDKKAIRQAMRSTREGRFIVWRREGLAEAA